MLVLCVYACVCVPCMPVCVLVKTQCQGRTDKGNGVL